MLLCCSLVLLLPAQAPAGDSKQALELAVGALLQGKGDEARSALEAVPTESLEAKDRQFRTCALSQLSADHPSPPQERVDSFTAALLALYQTYWRAAVREERTRLPAEEALLEGLRHLLGRPSLATLEETEPLIAVQLKKRKLFAQLGRTGVLYDLMVWRQTTTRVERVLLPQGANATRVHFLDGFLSLGWSSTLSCGRTGTGGWANEKGLFAIVPSYDSLTDENFRVNFLAHESQHFSDMKRYGELPSWRLEYRAKLVELAYADQTREQVLSRFDNSQSDDISDGHSYANRRVLQALLKRLGLTAAGELTQVATKRLQQAAVDELMADRP